MQKYSCLIVDDDDIDRLAIVAQVKKHPVFEIVGVYKSANEALPALGKPGLDVLFLDVDMPGLSGLEFRELATEIPVCIFISSYPEHAFRAFELETLDFIEKPLRSARFEVAVRRIESYMDLRRKADIFDATLGSEQIYIKEGHGKTRIDLPEVRFLEALKDYTRLMLPLGEHSVLSNIGTILTQPEFSSFVRIHRSFAVNKRYVKRIMASEVELDNGAKIPVGRAYKDALKQLL